MSQADEAYEILKDLQERQIKFQTYGKEGDNIRKWMINHKSENENDSKHVDQYGDFIGNYTYLFTNTGIGTVVKVRCNSCNEEYNATDYDVW